MIAAVVLAAGLSSTDETLAPGVAVSAAIHRRGQATIRTTDIGHVWSWENRAATMRAITDDAGIVRVVDVASNGDKDDLRFAPVAHVLVVINKTNIEQADNEVGKTADYTASTRLPQHDEPGLLRGYVFGSQTLALLFDVQHRVLREAVFGETETMARAGLAPRRVRQRTFVAPSLLRLGGADYASDEEGTAYLRLTVGKDGRVKNASIYVSSGRVQLDRIALANATDSLYRPASQDGRPIDAVVFRREDFARTP